MSSLAFDPLASGPKIPSAPVSGREADGAVGATGNASAERDEFNRYLAADQKPSDPAGGRKEAAKAPARTDRADKADRPADAARAAAEEEDDGQDDDAGAAGQVAALAPELLVIPAVVTVENPAAPVDTPAGEAEMPLPVLVAPVAGGDEVAEAAEAPAPVAAAPVAVQAPVADKSVQEAARSAAQPSASSEKMLPDGFEAVVAEEAAPPVVADGDGAEAARPSSGGAAASAAAKAVEAMLTGGDVVPAIVTAAPVKPVAAPTRLVAGLVTEEGAADEAAGDAVTISPVQAEASADAGELKPAVERNHQSGAAARPMEAARSPAEFSSLLATAPAAASASVESAGSDLPQQAVAAADVRHTPAVSVQTAQAGAERPTQRLMPVLEQVRIGLARAADQGAPSKLSLELAPRNLGTVIIEIDAAKDGQLRASLQADNPAALEILRREAPQLERSLQEAGYKMDQQSLSFSLRDQQSGRSGAEGQGRRGASDLAMPAAPVVEDEARVAPRSRATMGRVDVTV